VIIAHEADNFSSISFGNKQLVALNSICKRSSDDKSQRVSLGVSDGFAGRNITRLRSPNQHWRYLLYLRHHDP
jgi:hypothetical protein